MHNPENYNDSRFLISGVNLNGKTVDILISDGLIQKIDNDLPSTDSTVIEGKNMAAIPGLVNMHTHSAMTLLRGFEDDMRLHDWLTKKIWPAEQRLTGKAVYWGTRLACLEMIMSGTTTFLDSYFHIDAAAEAVKDTGIRATLGDACFDSMDSSNLEGIKNQIIKAHSCINKYDSHIKYSLAPHSIYSVSGETLKWLNEYSKDNGVPINLHIAETMWEVEYSEKTFGHTPVAYLNHLGLLSPRLILAHCLHVDYEERQMLADNGVNIVHNPASNMKLSSGNEFLFPFGKDAKIKVGLGTDGCASSNNLDMTETMKIAALWGKATSHDPKSVNALNIFESATSVGADILGLNTGRIEEGCLADLCLVDLNVPALKPNTNFISNLVYSANGSCVDTVICNGYPVMYRRKVSGQYEIMEEASKCAKELIENI